ncbi:MAG: DUF4493 domain-containing protein [Tannerellaceae bacterium]|nr:DUF4493 domain-containing protein [Tannerellaceae bacterium]
MIYQFERPYEERYQKFHSPVRTILFLLCILIAGSSFYSCADDIDNRLKDPGILSLTLASDTTFGNIVTTKAQILEELIPFQYINNYTVEILQGNTTVHSYDNFEDMPEEIELSAGAYTMKAYKGENKPAAFNSPYFEGVVDFVIEKGMRTPISDTCTLANTRVAVTYTDDFLDAYEQFRIRMNTEHMGTDTIGFKEDEIRGAYFKTDATGTDLNMNLWLVKWEDSVINYYKPSPLTIYPRENVVLLFKTDSAALNGIGLQVTINRAYDKDTTLNMTILEYAWGGRERAYVRRYLFPFSTG